MTEKERAKGVACWLVILRHADEVSGSVAKTCRYYGITRQIFYKWAKRYADEGADGRRDRSRRSLTSPNATNIEVVALGHSPAPELPLRTPEDLHVPQALARQRVRVFVPLARARPGHPPHLHQAGDSPLERQGGAIPPDRRRGVLPAPPGGRDRLQ